MNSLDYDLLVSWLCKEGVNSIENIFKWIIEQNTNHEVIIDKIALYQSDFWFYKDGLITNKNNSFFSISGIQEYQNGVLLKEQPIIIQPEIGLLGIICKKINGVIHFLMQAKIEPGNINKVQISPTIQATKSNFSQKHGGSQPAFLEYFLNAKQKDKLVDQIQSEQSSRFYRKRNRNIVLYVTDPILESSSHKWMTLGQIKTLMRFDNLVNMDTRTVISCIPFLNLKVNERLIEQISNQVNDRTLLRSLIGTVSNSEIKGIFSCFNDYKMFNKKETQLIDVYSLKKWHMKDNEFVSNEPFPFKIIFCNISIEGREVRNWTQPLFEAKGIATFGLFCCDDQGVKKFLTRATPEIGCFDGIELGPTIQDEESNENEKDEISRLFYKKLATKKGIIADVLLSEEGGRFYNEQNRNIIIQLENDEIPSKLPPGYFWCNYKTLNTLTQINNCLNIQLRNLLSLLEV
ncbi:NDP-hexose 2,3-dehydratase family protein [Solibacillus silvestris]